MWNTLKWSLGGLVFVLLVVLAGMVGYVIADDNGSSASTGSTGNAGDYAILNEIESILKEDFVNPEAVDPEALQRGAIDGEIKALNDSHTVYITPEDYQNGIDLITGSFEGIGANVDQDPTTGEITIVAPFRDSPAEQAGILPGDVILAVDGESTEGWSVSDAVNRIRGPQGTEVTLQVRHSDRTVEDVVIVRGTIVIPTVFARDVQDENGDVVPDLAYIEIQQFTDQTVEDLRRALLDVADKDYQGLILDLRRNPGGGLDATVAVADMFLDGGNVLTQVDRDGKRTEYDARPGGEAIDIPIAILVSNGSASGSEVLSGALRDNGRAKLVGQQTFGKGSVNHLRELSNGGALYVTIARWLTPNGTLIEGVGLTPDVTLETSAEDLSAELQRGYGPETQAAIDLLQDELGAVESAQ